MNVEKEAYSQSWEKEGSRDGCEKASSRTKLAKEGVHSNPC